MKMKRLNDAPALDVSELCIDLGTRRGPVRIVDQVSFAVARGGSLGVVGESGAGKSVTARAVLGVLPNGCEVTGGTVRINGEVVVDEAVREWGRVRGRDVAMIFQEPRRSLDPCFSVGAQIAEIARRHLAIGRRAAAERAVELLAAVGIADPRRRARHYPHELSGGMCQRVMIAMALAGEPSVLIADEPTTALDVTTQAKILELLSDLRANLGLALVLVTHDLGVVFETCDDILVMYAGEVVETGPTARVLEQPSHPYTRALLDSIPRDHSSKRLTELNGMMPAIGQWPEGCRFAPRCRHATPECAQPVHLTRGAIEDDNEQFVRCVHEQALRARLAPERT